jgi:hypothetical protein
MYLSEKRKMLFFNRLRCKDYRRNHPEWFRAAFAVA